MALTQPQSLHSAALQAFRVDRRTPYPCLQSDIDFHHPFTFRHPNNKPPVSITTAAQEILWQNDPNRKVSILEKVAISHLSDSIQSFNAEKETHGPDFAIKVFPDLDTIFFGGSLRGNVKVRWDSEKTKAHPP